MAGWTSWVWRGSAVLLCLALCLGRAAAAEQVLASFTKNVVQVTLTLSPHDQGHATLVAAFAPTSPDLHLYSLALPADADAGVATAVSFPPGGLTALGKPSCNQPDHLSDGLLVYPPGPILVTQQVQLPAAAGASTIIVSYMACTAS